MGHSLVKLAKNELQRNQCKFYSKGTFVAARVRLKKMR